LGHYVETTYNSSSQQRIVGESLNVWYYTLQKRKNSVAYTNKYYRTNCWKKKLQRKRRKVVQTAKSVHTFMRKEYIF